jgi:hypothetical protein
MSLRDFTEQEIVKELRERRKARRKQKSAVLRHPAKKQGAAYSVGDHEYLTDPVAKTKRRMEIFRNAGGEVVWFDESDPFTVEEIRPATCNGCVETHLVGWNEGHWHHNCELEKKCDAAACGLFVCPKSHRLIHGRIIKWTQREGAAERRE